MFAIFIIISIHINYFLTFWQKADEYEEMKKDTLQQLREFQLSLKKMMQVSIIRIELNQSGNILYPQPISTTDEPLNTNLHLKGNMTLVDQFGSVQLVPSILMFGIDTKDCL